MKNHIKYSKSISWFGDCRIPFVDEKEIWEYPNCAGGNTFHGQDRWDIKVQGNTQGRFPANILVCDDMLNDGNVSKNGDIKPHKQKLKTNVFNSNQVTSSFKSDKGTNSRYYDIDKWFEKLLDSCE